MRMQITSTVPYSSTQPPTLSGTGNEYQPKCGDALRLGSKGRYGSFHLWINAWMAGKTVLVGWLEFNVPFQHKYGYIRDEMSGAESYPYPLKEG